MYQVFCNSKAHRKYQPYSQEYKTIEEAKILLYEIAHIRKENSV